MMVLDLQRHLNFVLKLNFQRYLICFQAELQKQTDIHGRTRPSEASQLCIETSSPEVSRPHDARPPEAYRKYVEARPPEVLYRDT